MRHHRLPAASLLPFIFLAGCASIVDGSSQSLSVKTISTSGDIPGAACQLTSNKGTWFLTTPGTVTVHRSYDPLALKCTKDGYQPALQTTGSSTKGMAYGNILFCGLIGAGVDMSTGAAYDYPTLITVMMAPLVLAQAGPPAPVAPSGTPPSK